MLRSRQIIELEFGFVPQVARESKMVIFILLKFIPYLFQRKIHIVRYIFVKVALLMACIFNIEGLIVLNKRIIDGVSLKV